MLKTKSINKNTSILKVGVITVFASLLILLISMVYKLYSMQKSNVNNIPSTNKNTNILISSEWLRYENSKYGYEIGYPKGLTIDEAEDVGGYLHFIKFEEKQYSTVKGVAVGVSYQNLTSEIDRIKQAFETEGGARLASQTNLVINGKPGVLLQYLPDDDTLGEPRSLAIVENNGISISISTHPTQIDLVLKSFKLIN